MTCQHSGCKRQATCCIRWRSPIMSAPAFWYECEQHAFDDAVLLARPGNSVYFDLMPGVKLKEATP